MGSKSLRFAFTSHTVSPVNLSWFDRFIEDTCCWTCNFQSTSVFQNKDYQGFLTRALQVLVLPWSWPTLPNLSSVGHFHYSDPSEPKSLSKRTCYYKIATPQLYNKVSNFTTATAKVQQAEEKAHCECTNSWHLPPSLHPPVCWNPITSLFFHFSCQAGWNRSSCLPPTAWAWHFTGEATTWGAAEHLSLAADQVNSYSEIQWLDATVDVHALLSCLPCNYTPNLSVESSWLENIYYGLKMCLN